MKALFIKYYKDLFLGKRLFAALGLCVSLFLFTFFLPWLGDLPYICFGVLILLIFIDLALLFRSRGIFLRRDLPERLSNGDDNELSIYVESFFTFPVSIGIIDEIPFQFQKRDLWFKSSLKAGEHKTITYALRPVKRGEYIFGQTRLYVKSPLGLISRRFNFGKEHTVPVYPSFLQLRKYELMAISNRLTEIGIKKIRRVGHSMEFDQVKNYVQGDDYRTINWKATARKGDLMVNSFVDEKAQHIYCIIDKSRAMKMPFEGLSLMDYAINASLVLSNVALLKDDRAGLITLSEKIGSIVPADRRAGQLGKIMEVLYKEKTQYLESNIEALNLAVRKVIRQRSLIIFFTNYESMSALHRQLPFLKSMAKSHLLLIVFFENTEVRSMSEIPAQNVEGIYIKTIAEKFVYEKKLMVKELAKHGILSILTSPEKLTVNVVNRYLAIKAQQKI
ncbi:cell division protein DivIC (FtsB), stabilizes FtsL against RasP cleavage [Pedobacter lusitanus]|uniref:Cell division protein DivIC (FtsB), stabilizes FtsL against RasP cleavage n=1 Tax=Pedobacter lusitanus TaxID=1503925 RepID=A0A0D0GIX8_9SPHI|nr:DUF58 domain-containing protein [Pedobacter lusitanus]KIO77212.1 cell division protein DivIC (FtsB), stabilizes FtsL against RasP cleavage [Pedobacter lusitanus]